MNIDKQKWLYGGLAFMAIGFLLVGLLVPTVGTPSGGHLHGAYGSSRSRLSNYINALYMFRGEYGYFPSIFDDQGTAAEPYSST